MTKKSKKEADLIKVNLNTNTYVTDSILVLQLPMVYCLENSGLIKTLGQAIQKFKAAVTIRVI